MQYGTAAAKQQILDQISGRHTEVPQPTLTGVAKPAAKYIEGQSCYRPKTVARIVFKGDEWVPG